MYKIRLVTIIPSCLLFLFPSLSQFYCINVSNICQYLFSKSLLRPQKVGGLQKLSRSIFFDKTDLYRPRLPRAVPPSVPSDLIIPLRSDIPGNRSLHNSDNRFAHNRDGRSTSHIFLLRCAGPRDLILRWNTQENHMLHCS